MGLQTSNEKFENSSKGSLCAHVLQQRLIDDISVFQANMVSKFVSSLQNSKLSNLSRRLIMFSFAYKLINICLKNTN